MFRTVGDSMFAMTSSVVVGVISLDESNEHNDSTVLGRRRKGRDRRLERARESSYCAGEEARYQSWEEEEMLKIVP